MLKKKKAIDCFTCSGRVNGIFCELEGETLSYLDQSKNFNVYKKGQNLFLEGNPPFGLYCIHSGKVKLTKSDASGKETIIRLASSGEILGHRSLFSDSSYRASATVLEEGQICFISKQTINELIQKEAKVSLQIIKKLSEQIGIAEDKIASMARKNLRKRFAELLLLFKEKYGVQEDGKIFLDIKLTREEMSSMVGAAPENIIRLVTEFKKSGYIEQIGKDIYILNIEGLESEAGLSDF